MSWNYYLNDYQTVMLRYSYDYEGYEETLDRMNLRIPFRRDHYRAGKDESSDDDYF